MFLKLRLTLIVFFNDIFYGSFFDRSCPTPSSAAGHAAPLIVRHMNHLTLPLFVLAQIDNYMCNAHCAYGMRRAIALASASL